MTACVTGGETRAESVRAGVAEVPDDAAVILVHDAARPLLPDERRRARDRARSARASTAPSRGCRSSDTVKRVDGDGVVARRSPRDELVAVQTPQAFVAPVLRAALEPAAKARHGLRVARRGGRRPRRRSSTGDERLLKVTTRADLERVAAWLSRSSSSTSARRSSTRPACGSAPPTRRGVPRVHADGRARRPRPRAASTTTTSGRSSASSSPRSTWEVDDWYPDALPCIERLRDAGLPRRRRPGTRRRVVEEVLRAARRRRRLVRDAGASQKPAPGVLRAGRRGGGRRA